MSGRRTHVTFVLAMAALHFVLYGLILSLQRDTLTRVASRGKPTFKDLQRTVFAGELPSVLMLAIAPLMDMFGPMLRWAVVAIAIIISGLLVSAMLSGDSADSDLVAAAADMAKMVFPITGDEILSRSVIFPTLLTLLAIVNLAVDTFMIGHPKAWFMRGPGLGVGGAIAMILPGVVDEPVGGILAHVYALLFIVLCGASLGAYFQPDEFVPPSAANPATPTSAKERAAAIATKRGPVADGLRRYAEVWRTLFRRIHRTPMMPWWIVLATLSPALTSPARYRIAATNLSSPIVYWGKPVFNLISFFVAKTLIVDRKQIGLLFTAYIAASVSTIVIPEIADGNASAMAWVIMDSLFCLFDTARVFVCYSVAATLGHGCAATLLAMQAAIFTVGETFFIQVTLALADHFSGGCVAREDGERVCAYDAYGRVTRNLCAVGLFSMTLLYMTGTMTRCFYVSHDEGWRDAGRVMKRARTVFVIFTLVATVTAASFFIVVFS